MGVINGARDQHRDRCCGGCVVRAVSSGARWFHCPHQAPMMEEGDAVAEDRETHPGSPPGLRECAHDRAKRLGSTGIVYNSHPLLEFSLLVPRRLLKIAKTRMFYACIEFSRAQHSHVRGIAQALDCVLQI